MNQMMKECHAKVLLQITLAYLTLFWLRLNSWGCIPQAAQQIFMQRNTEATVLRGQIDLHGLHVAEAEECLRALLPRLRDLGVRQIHVITGSGIAYTPQKCLTLPNDSMLFQVIIHLDHNGRDHASFLLCNTLYQKKWG